MAAYQVAEMRAMDREQAEYHNQVKTVVIVFLGCGGALLGCILPIYGQTLYGTGSVILGAFVGLLIGFLLGAFIGLLLSWLVQLRPTASSPEGAIQARQLVGEMCVICHQRIGDLVEGTFCQACGSAVHHACVQAHGSGLEGRCQSCGGDPSVKLAPDYHG
jgi:hypothetical protein